MNFTGTLTLYALVGLAVAGALLRQRWARRPAPRRALLLKALVWLLAWPFFAPFIASGQGHSAAEPAEGAPSAAVKRARERLIEALVELSRAEPGWGPIIEGEVARARRITGALDEIASRLEEMSQLTKSPEFDRARAISVLADLDERGHDEDDPRVRSVRARLRNIDKLGALHRQAAAELERAALVLEEMSVEIRLLRFADAGAAAEGASARVEEAARMVSALTEALDHMTPT